MSSSYLGHSPPLFRQLSQQQWLPSPKSVYSLYVHTVYCSMHCTTEERVQLDWQWPLSGVHSIMMVYSTEPGEGGGARPPPFNLPSPSTRVVSPSPPLHKKTSEQILHCKKSLVAFRPQPGCHLPNSPRRGIIKLFPRQVEFG